MKHSLLLHGSLCAFSLLFAFNAHAEPCEKEKAQLNKCRTVDHPGSSCPKTTAKLNRCLEKHNKDGGEQSSPPPPTAEQCKPIADELAQCKITYPGSSCPRTTAKYNECLAGGSGAGVDNPEDKGGSTRCNNPDSDLKCMICNCYHEARGEPERGQIAVGKVVISRKNSGRYPLDKEHPKTLCGMIYDKNQFSWTRSSSKKNKLISGNDYKMCAASSRKAMDFNGIWAIHYHSGSKPSWANGCPLLEKIGAHSFYRDCDAKTSSTGGSSVVR